MEWLALWFALELGYQPIDAVQSYQPPLTVSSDGKFYQQAEARATAFGIVSLGGTIRVDDWAYLPGKGFGFFPNRLVSTFYGQIAFGPLSIGIKQVCSHPVTPFVSAIPNGLWDYGYQEIYLRLELGDER